MRKGLRAIARDFIGSRGIGKGRAVKGGNVAIAVIDPGLLCGAVDLEGIDSVQIVISVIHRDLGFAIAVDDPGFQITDLYCMDRV